jgi:hypothetical protein
VKAEDEAAAAKESAEPAEKDRHAA